MSTPLQIIAAAGAVALAFAAVAVHALWLRRLITAAHTRLAADVADKVIADLQNKLNAWNAAQQITHAEHLATAVREQVTLNMNAAAEAVAATLEAAVTAAAKPAPRRPRAVKPREPVPAAETAPVVELKQARKATTRDAPKG